jgi:glycosyltransferase involved in cell wall biosynthesis
MKFCLSIVVPVYSGEKYLEALVASVGALRQVWINEQSPVLIDELILVDDEAIDGSSALIENIAAENPWVVPLHLSRNYGQHGATVAGILHSSGEWIVTLDEDLQHPPERISELLAYAVSKQVDVVYAQPSSKVHGKLWRDGSSQTFKRVMEWLTGNPTLRMVNSFRLIRGSIARATASVCSHNTYFDIVLYWFTQRFGTVEMELSDDRFIITGKSGYNLKSLLAHAQRMLFSSQLRFLTVGIWIGIILFIASFFGGLYFVVAKIVAPEIINVDGWTSLFVMVCMSGGLLAVMLGLALQYLSTLVLKAHGRPTFFTINRTSDNIISTWFSEEHEKSRLLSESQEYTGRFDEHSENRVKDEV